MEIWILIGTLLASVFIGCTILEICYNIQMNKLAMEHPEFFSRTYDVSADEIRRALHAYKTSKVTTHLPTGEVDVLGPGKVYFFGGPKTGTITGVVSEEEMTDEAERLLKEARDRTID